MLAAEAGPLHVLFRHDHPLISGVVFRVIVKKKSFIYIYFFLNRSIRLTRRYVLYVVNTMYSHSQKST